MTGDVVRCIYCRGLTNVSDDQAIDQVICLICREQGGPLPIRECVERAKRRQAAQPPTKTRKARIA